MPTDVLVVDDELDILDILRETLSGAGFKVVVRESGDDALTYLAHHRPTLMLADLRMPGINGMELTRRARELVPDIQVVILTGYGDMKSAVEAHRLGAYDYLTKPVDTGRLVQTLRNGAEHYRLIQENRFLIHSLREANRIKTEFINGMSHEFRTPIGHILGFAQILQDTVEGLTEKQAHYLENIQTAAARLVTLFDNMLEFSILRSGETRISPAPFSLLQFLEKGLGIYSDTARVRDLSLEIQSPETDEVVVADLQVCQKVLSLLLDNAVKFSPDGSRIALRADVLSTPSVSGASAPDLVKMDARDWLHVTVSDTGPGIAPEDQVRVFNLFEQGDPSLARPHEGTGIGLALARSLVQIHGGTIFLKSRPGEGSTFTFVIPLSEGA